MQFYYMFFVTFIILAYKEKNQKTVKSFLVFLSIVLLFHQNHIIYDSIYNKKREAKIKLIFASLMFRKNSKKDS